jgi:uncharacterized protein (TIGR02302 family)
MRELSRRDLQSMIDRMERLARSGAKDAAKALLDQMQQMLDNLQMARPGQTGDDDGDDMMSALDDLGDMIREQQQLRDKTFRQGQDQRGRQRGQQQGRQRQPGQQGQQRQQGQQGDQGQEGDQNGFGELQQNQQALRDRLNKLLDDLKQKGLGQQPGGDGLSPDDNLDNLGDAGSAMGDAQQSLGEGNADNAVGSQGRALDAMRKGAQNLAQQLQQQMGQGNGPGQPGGPGRQRADQSFDPLGRPLHERNNGREFDDSTVKVPGEIDVQRARRILEELRRRLGDTGRSQLELDYLERLLKDY